MSTGKVIAVVDPLTGGHHLGYIRLMAKAILESGHKVWVFCPGAEQEVLPWLKQEGFEHSVQAFDLSIKKKPYTGFRRFAHAAETLQLWRQISHPLREAEKKENQRIQFVFFAWLDSFLANYLPHQLIDVIFPYRWSGLYFHPMYLLGEKSTISSISSIDYVLKSRRCKTVFIQDEFLIEKLRRRINKTVAYFPQITDQAFPDKDFYLAREIRQKAGNRKVVGLIGVDKRKGLLSFLALVRKSNANRFYFFIAGPIQDPDYTAEEIICIHDFLEHLPQNCMYYPNYLKEGAEINGIIDALDIVYQVYYRFRSASNFTTKAAFLQKPVLAKDADWIGEVTKKYSLGVTVPEDDNKAIGDGLVKLDNLITEGSLVSDYEDYLKKNSFSALKESMNTML